MAITERLAILIDASSGGAVREFQKLSGAAATTEVGLTKGAVAASAFKGALGAIGVATVAQGLFNFGRQAVDAASALEEMKAKSEVVFGPLAGEIEDFATTSADAFNLSERQAYQFASSFGQLFDSAGVAERDMANFSQSLTALAGDIASFNDITVEEAFQKLRSGLSGEAEPLRQVGVFLSEAKVKAEAYSTGIAQTGETLTEAQKIQARYNIIMRETESAQGDVARTSESLANQQRDLTTEMEDFRASVGSALSGDIAMTVGALADMLDVVTDLNNSLSSAGGISGVLKDGLVPALTGIAGPVGVAVQGMLDWSNRAGEATGNTADLNTEIYHFADGVEESVGPATKATLDQLNAMGRSAKVAADEVKGLSDAITGLGSETLDAREAQREFQAAVDDARKALKDNGRTLNANTEAGRANADALDEIASSGKAASAAVLAQTRSTDKANAVMREARQAYINAAVAAGMSAEQARRLATAVGLVPNKKTVTFSTPGADASISKVRELGGWISSLPSQKVIEIVTRRVGPMDDGQRASGGPVSSGRTYMVGERGPELLTMRGSNGHITSNARTRTMGNQQPTVVYNVYGTPDGATIRTLRQHERLHALTSRMTRGG